MSPLNKRTLIFSVAVILVAWSLVGCGVQQASAVEAPIKETSTVETRLERIEALLTKIEASKRTEERQFVDYDDCTKKCQREYPMSEQDRATPWEQTEYAKCYKSRCEPIQPAISKAIGC